MKISSKLHAATRNERGGVLVLSLIAVFTVTVLAASFSQFASSVANRQAHAVNRKRAFYLAEAGLAEAFQGFSCGRSGSVGTPEQPVLLGDGVFWVEATEVEPGIFRLESTGMAGTGRAELALIAQRGSKDVSSLGVFSSGDLSLPAGSTVDAYDSSLGSYETQLDKTGATLGSNGAITVSGTLLDLTNVQGDVTPGPEQEVTTSGEVTITGSTDPAMMSNDLPAIETPELSLESAQVHDSPYPLVIAPGMVGLEGLSVATGSQVILQGPAVVVLGSLDLAPLAELSFDTTQGKITLYVLDGLELSEGSFLTSTTSAPEDVKILVPGETLEPVHLGSAGAFHGVVYAPQTQVVVSTGFELFGALVASSLTFDGPASLHFDLHLAELAAEEALPKVLTWRLESLATASGDLSQDPFEILGVDRSTLPDPSSGHADQTLFIDYYDASDVYHRYNGPESAFDWNVVKTVIFALRDGTEVLFPRGTTIRSGTIKAPGVLPVIDGPMI